MKLDRIIAPLIIVAIAVFFFFQSGSGGGGADDPAVSFSTDPVTPNWAAISAWPPVEVPVVEATPDPNRRITVIVLDDSGSMANRIDLAKAAVVEALGAMDPADRVAVVALNAGTVLPFTTVSDAARMLPPALTPILADGSTPLTRAILEANELLAAEAAMARGFGTFRMIVTTDGRADDPEALDTLVQAMAESTPIQLTTIGIELQGRHVLRRDDLASYVDVADVALLGAALQDAVAENADFAAITDFSTGE